ncbi:G-protein-signaling modulator 2-like isoform X2 [Pecten maximus]|uniref:G-protein-signaling modulator 2-like isoform X2 n=1 Tax=Pecten maximus TaxID=6579 RepID=UPI0014588853|nr:G-protein-signaling modulator 2-like isoform X2 [Pecten maximus]
MDSQASKKMECTCMELALEGERLCKAGDCRTGVHFFEAAVQTGTDDLKTLSAIYSQLGNAYFYLQEYAKALEYHKLDLSLARTLSDKVGEAKASGNLGNTLKVLGKFEEAIACCLRHLDIAQELGDKVSEARALYNLGNVYHAQGKHTGRCTNEDPGEFPEEVRTCLQKAAEYYEANLQIVKDLGDKAAQGRACGNLGNTNYLLGNFSEAIQYHQERLAIAKEFGDKSAERRAYSNLGNAHIFLGEFEVAAEQYRRTLQIAKQLGDKALEAQACYSLGNTFTLLQDYEKAIEYHMRHLKIAQDLNDRVGEGRACWSLGNAHSSLGNNEIALEFASKHLQISKEIGDENGQFSAQMNLADLRNVLGINMSSAESTPGVISHDGKLKDETDLAISRRPFRRHSMENMELMKLTPDKKGTLPTANGGARPKVPKFQKAASIASNSELEHRPKLTKDKSVDTSHGDEDSFFDLVSKFQSRRIDDQRCSFKIEPSVPTPKPPVPTVPVVTKKTSMSAASEGNEEFLDMVAGIQSSRMNDQRAALPQFPGLNSQTVIDQFLKQRSDSHVPDDNFFEMLMRCQGSRIEDQRSSLPQSNIPAPTVPDEDFFSLIQKVQSSRLEEQRTSLPDKPTTETQGKKKKK